MVKFINFQLTLLRWTTYIQLCRYYIVEDVRFNRWSIKYAGNFWVTLFVIVWVNTWIKAIYLFATYHGWLGVESGFLDKIIIIVYFIFLIEMVQETTMFCRPMHEIFLANWKLQKEICTKHPPSQGMQQSVDRSDKFLVGIHL